MGSYLNAPATKLLATHCAVCRKSLVDAVSVELGIGPDCRKRYFAAADPATEANRPAANKLVYLIAAKQEGPEVLEAVKAVRALGFGTLADILVKRLAKVQITVEGERLLVKAPYSETAVPLMAKITGRVWDKARKINTYPVISKAALWEALKKAYPGLVGHGPQGFFTIGGDKSGYPTAEDKAWMAEQARTMAEANAKLGSISDELEMQRIEAEGDRAQTLREEKAKAEAKAALEGGIKAVRSRFS